MVTHVSGQSEVTVAQAARILGCHERTIYRNIYEGVLPAEKIGHRIRIKVSDLSLLGEVKPPDPIREAAIRVVEQAPQLTPEQLAGICNLLRGVA